MTSRCNPRLLLQVPGIAARGAELLAQGEGDECVTNTYQLIGKFLSLRGPDKDDHEVRGRFDCAFVAQVSIIDATE